MSGCGRIFCEACGQELIHRDRRHGHESASALGQIIHREGPRDLTVGDIDLYSRKWDPTKRATLLRVVEHKQPAQVLKLQQQRVLADLEAIIRHCVTCETAPLSLDARSGLFVLRGEIATDEKQITRFAGPQELRTIDGRLLAVLRDAEDVFSWLEGAPGGARRSGGRAAA